MNRLSSVRRINQMGFSLIEMMVVTGLISIVAIGASMQMQQMYNRQQQATNKVNMLSTQSLIHSMFGKVSSNSTWTCANAVTVDGGGPVRTTGTTNIQITPHSGATAAEIFKTGQTVTGPPSFTINQLYLGDLTPVSGTTTNTYLANLYMSADVGVGGASSVAKSRNIATFILQLDSSNNIIGCNFDTSSTTPQQRCAEISGMWWDPNPPPGRCASRVDVQADNSTTSCPPATHHRADGLCIPEPSDCGGQLATNFSASQVQQCQQPPLNNNAIGVPTLPVPTAQINQPSYTPAPIPPANPYQPVTTGAPVITSSVPASTPVPASCPTSNVNSINNNEYSDCQGHTACNASLTGADTPFNASPSSCSTQSGSGYTAPAATPAPLPPPDYTCQCGSARIANNAYCAFCINNVNYGYGSGTYTGVEQCVNGVLVNATGAPAVDTSVCTAGYAPTRMSGSRLIQYNIRDAIP